MPASVRQSIIVTVKEDALERIEQIAEALRGRGMAVDSVLTAAGTVTGWARPSEIQDISLLDGVETVELARRVQHPLPDADIQ